MHPKSLCLSVGVVFFKSNVYEKQTTTSFERKKKKTLFGTRTYIIW